MYLQQILKPQYDYINSLDSDTKEIIREYTGTAFSELNQKLRTNQSLNAQQSYMVKILDRTFLSTPVLRVPILVYRGISQHLISQVSAYISTSSDIDRALRFTNSVNCCLLRITVSPGTKILPIPIKRRKRNSSASIWGNKNYLSGISWRY